MNELKWNDRFNIGVEVVDRAHQRLFSIVSKLINLNEDEDKQQHACREGIKYFKSYTLKHFQEEEEYMQSIGYEDYAIHKSLHDNMRDNTIPALESELEAQNYSVEAIQHFIGICVGWLEGHIMIEDHAITGRTSRKWIHNTSDDEMASLEKATIQALQDLFRVKAHIISKHYSCEDFSSGSALCYRLTYCSPSKQRRQVFVVYEEQMVLRTLGELLQKQIKRTDKTVSYAIKILSQQLVDCIGKHFTITNGYLLDRNDMLTFDQFIRTFDREYPPYSLLFNIEGKGYFALCVK